MSEHLSEEQFSDILAGRAPDAVAQAHLAQCESCRAEVASLQSAVIAFNEASLTWAELRAPRLIQTPSRLAQFLGGRPAWDKAAAATFAVAAVMFGFGLSPLHGHPGDAAKLEEPAPSTAEIAQDNRLLASINQELQSGVQPSFSAAELRVPVHRRQSMPVHRMVR